jgi:hypothetical protein
MPCGIKVEVSQGIDFLQVVNTTFYATTMDFSKDSSLKNHNSHILVFLFSFLQYYLFLIANVRKTPNMNFSRFTLFVLLLSSIMGSSTLKGVPPFSLLFLNCLFSRFKLFRIYKRQTFNTFDKSKHRF